ncbi:MAG: OmpH family outer membrane protein [Spirochaetaceae bacterium]
MKRVTILAVGFLLLFTVAVGAEQLTTVGIIDISRIYNSFYRDSQAVRELEDLRSRYQAEIDREAEELEELNDDLERAEDSGNESRIEQLESRISRQRSYVEDLTRRRRSQLQQRQQNLVSDDFLNRLQRAIEYVAESEGYSVVIRTDQEGLQWWSSSVDISELVLERLRESEG